MNRTSKQRNHFRFFKNIIFFTVICFTFSGCGIYSFTGASISPDVKTVSIQYFANNASIVQPTLAQSFTQALRDKFASQTNLTQVKSNGDLNIEGEITEYIPAQPTAIQGNETSALNRFTVKVNVRFTNKLDSKQNFETSFERYVDYESTKNLSQIEQDLIKQINDLLVEDIFNKAVVNW